MLSRSGLELNDIWYRQAQLVEMDVGLRKLERTLASSGSHADWTRLTNERLRAGHDSKEMAHRLGRSYLARNAALRSVGVVCSVLFHR